MQILLYFLKRRCVETQNDGEPAIRELAGDCQSFRRSRLRREQHLHILRKVMVPWNSRLDIGRVIALFARAAPHDARCDPESQHVSLPLAHTWCVVVDEQVLSTCQWSHVSRGSLRHREESYFCDWQTLFFFGKLKATWEPWLLAGGGATKLLFGTVVCGLAVLNKQTGKLVELSWEFFRHAKRSSIACGTTWCQGPGCCNERCALGFTSRIQGWTTSLETLECCTSSSKRTNCTNTSRTPWSFNIVVVYGTRATINSTRTTGAARSHRPRSSTIWAKFFLSSAWSKSHGRHLLESAGLVDEALDATTQIRAKTAWNAGPIVEKSSTSRTVDEDMPSRSITTARIRCETSTGERRLMLSGSSTLLSLAKPQNTWESMSCQLPLWTPLVNLELSRENFKNTWTTTSTMRKRRRWPRAGWSMSSPRDGDTHEWPWMRTVLCIILCWRAGLMVDPPQIWKDAEAAAGRYPARLLQMKRVLYGRRKAPREWPDFSGQFPHSVQGPWGQVVVEPDIHDLHASGPLNMLPEITKNSRVLCGSQTCDNLSSWRNRHFGTPSARAYPHSWRVLCESQQQVRWTVSVSVGCGKQETCRDAHCCQRQERCWKWCAQTGQRDFISLASLWERCSTWGKIEAMQPMQFVFWLVTPCRRRYSSFETSDQYLHHTRDLATFYPWEKGQAVRHLVVYTDGAWAGDRSTRKRSSCVVWQVGGCVLSVICRGQQIRAQSSAEAEVFAEQWWEWKICFTCKSSMGESMRARLWIDWSAGRSVPLRAGVGRIRQLDVTVLWTQDQTCSGLVAIGKCDGAHNVNEIGTKPLGSAASERHREALGLLRPSWTPRTGSELLRKWQGDASRWKDGMLEETLTTWSEGVDFGSRLVASRCRLSGTVTSYPAGVSGGCVHTDTSNSTDPQSCLSHESCHLLVVHMSFFASTHLQNIYVCIFCCEYALLPKPMEKRSRMFAISCSLRLIEGERSAARRRSLSVQSDGLSEHHSKTIRCNMWTGTCTPGVWATSKLSLSRPQRGTEMTATSLLMKAP